MKKILLLLAASLVLYACEKDGPQEVEQVADLREDTTEVTCECGATYSVTCFLPDYIHAGFGPTPGFWNTRTAPTFMWEVLNKSNNNAVVTFDEWDDYSKIKFECQTEGCNEEMTFYKNDFRKELPFR
ncbi:MAG: hypothetical protein MJY89_09300 [Bacteroidales bacterium]|nr:hypothetical protein [Bacteroidales bacterium]